MNDNEKLLADLQQCQINPGIAVKTDKELKELFDVMAPIYPSVFTAETMARLKLMRPAMRRANRRHLVKQFRSLSDDELKLIERMIADLAPRIHRSKWHRNIMDKERNRRRMTKTEAA